MDFHLDEETRAALAAIRSVLEAAGEDASAADALRWSLLIHAHFLEGDTVAMTRADLSTAMLAYAAHCLEAYTGESVRVVPMEDGKVVFVRASPNGETESAPVAVPMAAMH